MTKGKPLTGEQRETFAEKLMDWGNLVFVGLVIGQLVPGTGPFRLSMVFAGLVSIAVSYVVAYYLMKGGA